MSVYSRGEGAFLGGKFNQDFCTEKLPIFSFFGEIQKQIMNP